MENDFLTVIKESIAIKESKLTSYNPKLWNPEKLNTMMWKFLEKWVINDNLMRVLRWNTDVRYKKKQVF